MYQLFEKGDILNTPIECFEFHAGQNAFPVRPHWHYFLELLLMVDGEALIRSEDQEYVLHPGEMALFHPKELHEISGHGDKPPVFLGIKLNVSSLTMESKYIPKLRGILQSGHRHHMRTHFSKEFVERNQFEFLFRDCIREVNSGRYGYDLLLKSSLYRILITILRSWQDDGFVVENETFSSDDDIDIYTITEYIDKNIGNRIKVSDIAAKVNMSYSCFSRKFIDVYGKSCKEYMDDMRLIMVEDYLRFTDFDLTSIALETGYTDCSHMIKCFKDAKGITPKQYRVQLRNER